MEGIVWNSYLCIPEVQEENPKLLWNKTQPKERHHQKEESQADLNISIALAAKRLINRREQTLFNRFTEVVYISELSLMTVQNRSLNKRYW